MESASIAFGIPKSKGTVENVVTQRYLSLAGRHFFINADDVYKTDQKENKYFVMKCIQQN